MVECNREEAVRARRIALRKLQNKDFSGARRIALQARRLYPDLENLSQLLTICEVYCAAETNILRELDWHGILQVEVTADDTDDTVITKHYDKLTSWLHPDKNTLPGANAAFKFVSEARAILSDNAKRSLYDIKRQHASREVAQNVIHQSGKTHSDKCNMAGRITLRDFAMVFSTICPHCQRRFMFYQRNFLVSCDGCGKNFFAFKLHEQAVHSRFLSAAPNNSQVRPEMISCQQHCVPNQQIQCNKDHNEGGNMDYESLLHASQSDDIECDGRSCGDREGRSETRSSVTQFSAVNYTHSSSPSGDEGTIESMMLDSSDPNFVANQNLSREDASAVLNAAAPCCLEGLNKRKPDDCIDSSHNRDSRNNKKQMIDDSLSLCDPTLSNDIMKRSFKVSSDNVPVTKNQSAEHLSIKMEENATHVGNQEKYEETMLFTYQMYDNSDITYKCPDFFDFGKLRDFKRIAVGQIWAVYDDHDLMPRVYAQINHVDASNLKVHLTWLEHNTMNELKSRWTYEELSVACGNYCLGETYVLKDPSMYLSHRVSWKKRQK
ncbi:unnamed protein product [Urochloa humidicola]